jgi:hypothetical protein
MKRIIRTTRVLVGSAVMALAVLAACGGDPDKTTSPAAPERDAAVRARLEAQAEQHEWSAHLQGQARRYGAPAEADSSDDAPTPAGEMSDEEFVPGSRHMPMR